MSQGNEIATCSLSSAEFTTLRRALASIRTLLKVLGQADADRLETLNSIFADVSLLKLQQLLAQFGQGNFDSLPNVAVCSRAALLDTRASDTIGDRTVPFVFSSTESEPTE